MPQTDSDECVSACAVALMHLQHRLIESASSHCAGLNAGADQGKCNTNAIKLA